MQLSRELATLQLFPADLFDCTDAQLMMSFATSDLGVPKVPLNPTTKRAAQDYIEICRLGANLDSLSSDSITLRTNAKEVLDKLASAYPAKSSNDTSGRETDYKRLKDKAEPVIEESVKLDQLEKSLKENYAKGRAEAMVWLKNIFTTIARAPDPEAQSNSQVTQNELKKVKGRYIELKKLIDQFVKNRRLYNQRLYDIHHGGYHLLPTPIQASVVPPASQAPTPSK